MSSLIIHNATVNDYTDFIDDITSFLTTYSDGGIVVTDDPMTNPGTSIYTMTGTAVSPSGGLSIHGINSKGFKFSDFNDICFGIIGGHAVNNWGTAVRFINCIPLIRFNRPEGDAALPNKVYTTFYTNQSKLYTSFSTFGGTDIYSSFRTMLYVDDNTKYVSLGLSDSWITISEHIFTYIDDPTITKQVLCVTASDNYITFYDAYSEMPWYIENTNHNGHNIGKSNAINAYKFMIKGYYCDNLYYFDGGNTMPGEGVSTMGGIKFLKTGCNNLFIKME